MSKKFWLAWLGLVWLNGCGGDSSLGSGRDSENRLSNKDEAGAEETDDAANTDPGDSNDDDATSTPDEQEDEVDAPAPSNDADDDDDTSASGGELSMADDDDTGTNGGDGMSGGAGGGASTGAVDAGVSQGAAGSSSNGVAGMSNVEPAHPSQLDAYELRDGSFSMLVYSKTTAFRHEDSINTGKALLQEIADKWNFDVVFTETNENFTVAGLSQFEIVFFLNTSGDVLNDEEQTAYETWMTEYNGAFAGTHSATDTEQGWAFYAEVTGQYYDGHGQAGTPGEIQFEASALAHPALAGLPNPWQREEEWFNFNSHAVWSVKPGFTILGRKAADGQPIMWTREWNNFRSFYTAIGHAGVVFDGDENVERHLTGGILWAVRRAHWLD